MAAETFQEALQQDIANLKDVFIERQEAKAARRRPRRVGYKPKYGTLAARRNWRISVAEAAMRRVQIILTYTKITTGETKKWIVFPYSYRYRRLRAGRRKLLFAYDMKDKHIKGFLTRNIKKVALTDRKHRPRWPVEIGPPSRRP